MQRERERQQVSRRVHVLGVKPGCCSDQILRQSSMGPAVKHSSLQTAAAENDCNLPGEEGRLALPLKKNSTGWEVGAVAGEVPLYHNPSVASLVRVTWSSNNNAKLISHEDCLLAHGTLDPEKC
ncbi:unnamed protein product [Eretmochelys imbricata]